MSRKKMQRSAKPKAKKIAVKRQVKPAGLSVAESMEKDFREMPAKLVAHFGKDLAALKKQENKLSSALKKAEAKKKMAKDKCATFAAKSTPAAKKSLVVAKKAYNLAHAAVSNLASQLEQAKKLSKAASQKQAKFAELSKQILKLEKQFEAEAKKKPTKMRAKARKKSVKSVESVIVTSLPIEPATESVELPMTASTHSPEENS